jgi:hypothetical protein
MGMSTTPVMFTDDRLAIKVEECTPKFADYLRKGKKLSLRQFSRGNRTCVEKVNETDEFIFQTEDGREFARGPVAR